MKKIICCIFLLGAFHLSGQTIFEQYGGNAAVTQLNVSPQMFQLLSKLKISTDDPDSQAFIEMIKGLKRFRVMSTQDASIAADMENWYQNELEQTTLETVLNLTEKGVNVRFGAIYGQEEASVERLVMYVKGLQEFIDKQENLELNTATKLDYILLEIKGNIDLNQVGTLTQLIDIPGGEYLNSIKN